MDRSADDLNNNVQVNGHKNQSNGAGQPNQREESHERQSQSSSSGGTGNEPRGQRAPAAAKPSIKQEQPMDRHKYELEIEELKNTGRCLRSDVEQPSLLQKPDWFDEDLFENAKSVYGRHFMGINFAHLSGLLLLVRVSSIYRTLSVTGKSDSVAKLFRRYYQTVIYVKRWYEGDIFEENSEAHNSLLIVRGMHNKVSSDLNNHHEPTQSTTNGQAATSQHDEVMPCTDSEQSRLMTETGNNQNGDLHEEKEAGMHISQYDIMLTQFAFLGFIVTRAKNVGLIEDFSRHDLESLLHFWRVIGYYLGASEKFNLCSRDLDEVVGICKAIMEVEFKQSILKHPISSPPGIMGVNIVRSIKFIPMLTIYGITKYLYELILIDTSEFEARATRYSRLSYTLIKLVMSRLLAYKGFRLFNNGLTRLSLFLVGKMEHTFANHLDSKYGQELKL